MPSRVIAIQGAGTDARAFATQGWLVTTIGVADREVAVQGIGFGAGSTALQGFYRRGAAGQDFAPTWGPKVYPKKSPRRRDRDDDVLLFLLR